MNKYTLILLFAFFSYQSAMAQNLYTSWDEASILKYWKKNGLKQYEGIYYSDMAFELKDVYTKAYKFSKIYYALKLNEQTAKYELIYLKGKDSYTIGEIHAFFKNFYQDKCFVDIVENCSKGLIAEDKYWVKIENGNLKITSIYTGKYLMTYFKDPTPLNFPVSGEIKSSGTGFAISSNGYIATNYHVVEDANSISIKGIRGNFDISYNAEVVLEDVKNDIAILKISDTNFSSLGKIPYIITSSQLEVGNNVSALGYPLRATMGDEVKYTNGVISSKSGYQGDLTMYQTSVPVQPGNSGGPLISPKGNIIGIISAKHDQAENVSYALKTAYLINLIENLSPKPVLNSTNTISTLSTPDKIKTLKNFVYIIEVR